ACGSGPLPQQGRQDGDGSRAVRPPSSTMISPVRNPAFSLARKTARSPTSVGRPVRPTGWRAASAARAATGSWFDPRYVSLRSERIYSASLGLYSRLCEPRYTSRARFRHAVPDLLVQYAARWGFAPSPSIDPMLMMVPPPRAFISGATARGRN